MINIQIQNWDKGNGQIFNVGRGLGKSVSLLELTDLVQGVTKNKISISSNSENRPADLRIYVTDNSKVERDLNWKPEKSLEQLFHNQRCQLTVNKSKKLQLFGKVISEPEKIFSKISFSGKTAPTFLRKSTENGNLLTELPDYPYVLFQV